MREKLHSRDLYNLVEPEHKESSHRGQTASQDLDSPEVKVNVQLPCCCSELGWSLSSENERYGDATE